MKNSNQVFVTIRPIGDWLKACEKVVAAGASICFESFGFEHQLEKIWKQYLIRFRTGIFAVSCNSFETAKVLQELTRELEVPSSSPLRAIIPWHRISREQAIDLKSMNPIPRIGSIQEVEQYARFPWEQQNDPCAILEGYESGGLCGRDSQYILLQKALGCLQDCRLIAAGPVGLLSFSALKSQGIRSIILDEQILLLQDSYLPQRTKLALSRVNGRQSIVIRSAEDDTVEVRCIIKPGKESSGHFFGSRVETSRLKEIATWSSEGTFPVGEGIDLAKDYSSECLTIGRVISSYRTITQNRHSSQLQANSIAEQFGVEYPVIQGPMSRVSDNAEFASSVAKGGALPTIAAAMLTDQALEEILIKTAELIPGMPWGVGLLGFIDYTHLQSQIAVLKRSRASFCILAGGTPAQAKEIATNGLRVFIHAPTPELLELFIKEGWRDFILEGRECGGHIGPLSSLNLWERSIKAVLKQSVVVRREVCLVLAGGIHDQTSAAFAAYMLDDLVKAGTNYGLLVGSAYLATREIIEDRAITSTYQKVSLECARTVFLETSPGHQSRCADTAFSREFNAIRDELIRAQVPVREISNQLDRLILGRLRLASKGLQRGEGGLVQVTDQAQRELGMYMLGEAVCLINSQTTIRQLHESIKAGLEAPSGNPQQQHVTQTSRYQTESANRGKLDIAIIGMSCRLPGANSPQQFWDLVMRAKCQIQEIPENRWSIEDFYSADPKVPNKVHSKWGGFLDAVRFDPIEFGIPPQSLSSIDPAQLLALVCVKDALQDAGYSEDSLYDRESTCVVLGYSGGLGELGQGYVMQAELAPLLTGHPDIERQLPAWTSDSFAGILPNVSAGRVANRFDFGGTNCAVDAACASSLAALDIAINKLRQGDASMAVVGAIDTLQSPFAYFCFSETHALSPTGQAKSFTNEADGIVLGEGAGILILKRLEDAEADGDTIHAVIKGIGSSSDGRCRTMTAPSHQGQVQAFARAYSDAGVDPATLGYYEAHGTGTPVGDRSEIRALTTFLEAQKSPNTCCAVGSVKTLIGHTKSTAGLAGLLKATLALKHKSIPLHSRTEEQIDEVICSSAVYLPTGSLPWLKNDQRTPRTAGVSAFGFGGTNFHAVLQEYIPQPVINNDVTDLSPQLPSGYRLLYFKAKQGCLSECIRLALAQALEVERECAVNGCLTSVNQLIADTITCHDICTHQHGCADDFAIVLADLSAADIGQKLAIVSELLNKTTRYTDAMRQWLVCQSKTADLQIEFKQARQTALLFPGQGSDYPGMGATCMVATQLRSHELLLQLIPDKPTLTDVLNRYLFSRSEKSIAPPPELKQSLLAITEMAYLDILNYLEIPWSIALGHSLGDFVSLFATGWMTDSELVDLLRARGEAVSTYSDDGYGMLILFCSIDQGKELLKNVAEHSLTLANINSPSQIVLSGLLSDIERVEAACMMNGVSSQRMQAKQPFHSILMQECNNRFINSLSSLNLRTGRSHSHSAILSTSPESGPVSESNIDKLITAHMTSSVDFIESVKQAERLGCTLYIEVGPKKVLSKLVQSSLSSTGSVAVSLDGPQGTDSFVGSIMRLGSYGVTLTWSRLDQMLRHTGSGYQAQQKRIHREPGLSYFINGASSWQSGHRVQKSVQHNVHRTFSTTGKSTNQNIPEPNSADTALLESVQLHPHRNEILPMNELNLSNQSNPPNEVSSLRLEAFRTYHETLRMMIDSQTQVFSAYLNQSGDNPASLASPPLIVTSSPLSESPTSLSSDSPEAQTIVRNSASTILPNVQQQQSQSPAPSSHAHGNVAMIDTLVSAPSTPVQSTFDSQATEPTSLLASNGDALTDRKSRQGLVQLDTGSILSQLTSILSEKSGYPVELLDPDQDLESDLGIDSIKRIEVMGGFMATLSDIAPETIQSIQTGTRDLRSLKEVSQYISSALSAGTSIDLAAEVSQPGK